MDSCKAPVAQEGRGFLGKPLRITCLSHESLTPTTHLDMDIKPGALCILSCIKCPTTEPHLNSLYIDFYKQQAVGKISFNSSLKAEYTLREKMSLRERIIPEWHFQLIPKSLFQLFNVGVHIQQYAIFLNVSLFGRPSVL